MNNFGALLSVLANNQSDVEDLINKFGGVGNIIRAAPSLIHIMQTISRSKDPVAQTEVVKQVLSYSEETKAKVLLWQKAHGLDADGIVGNQTWSKIEELTKGK